MFALDIKRVLGSELGFIFQCYFVYIYTHTKKKIYSPQILVILCHTHVITFSCYQCTLAKLLQSCLTLCQYTKLN